jgi:hypothetical protein
MRTPEPSNDPSPDSPTNASTDASADPLTSARPASRSRRWSLDTRPRLAHQDQRNPRTRRVCLDIAHRHPDMSCPWCDGPEPPDDPVITAAHHQHEQTRTEDHDGFQDGFDGGLGWAA